MRKTLIVLVVVATLLVAAPTTIRIGMLLGPTLANGGVLVLAPTGQVQVAMLGAGVSLISDGKGGYTIQSATPPWALVAMRTKIPGPRDFYRAQSGQHAPRAQFAVTRLATAGTRKSALLFGGLAEPQQLAEGGGAGTMQSSAEGHFHRFHIRLAGLLALGEDAR
jgi:hypothetical protein